MKVSKLLMLPIGCSIIDSKYSYNKTQACVCKPVLCAFYNDNGAQGSAIIFSLIETAKEAELNPYKYLVYLLKTALKLSL